MAGGCREVAPGFEIRPMFDCNWPICTPHLGRRLPRPDFFGGSGWDISHWPFAPRSREPATKSDRSKFEVIDQPLPRTRPISAVSTNFGWDDISTKLWTISANFGRSASFGANPTKNGAISTPVGHFGHLPSLGVGNMSDHKFHQSQLASPGPGLTFDRSSF